MWAIQIRCQNLFTRNFTKTVFILLGWRESRQRLWKNKIKGGFSFCKGRVTSK